MSVSFAFPGILHTVTILSKAKINPTSDLLNTNFVYGEA